MIHTVKDVQVALLALTLLAAAIAKMAFHAPPGEGDAAAPHLLHNRPLTVGLVLSESLLGIGLLISTHIGFRLATALGFVGALWVVSELKNRRPEAGCGCFGGLSTARVGRRTILRTALFVVASLVALTAPCTGVEMLRNPAAGWSGVLLLVELAVFAALSPELGVAWSRRRLRVPCEQRTAPLAGTFQTLHASDAWRSHRRMLTVAEPVDVWRELCWRFLVYPARLDGQDVEIVFAVSLEDERQPAVRAAVVERGDDDDCNSGPNAAFVTSR